MNPVMYIFANADLRMSHGKLGAQTAHAAVGAFEISKPDMIEAWKLGGHTTKIVLHADDERTLDAVERYVNDRGFQTDLIIDEGRTEIKPFSSTALGVEIVDKDDPHTKATFEHFKLYKHPKPKTAEKLFSDEAKFDPGFLKPFVDDNSNYDIERLAKLMNKYKGVRSLKDAANEFLKGS